MNKDLYCKLVCALTHDIQVCDECRRCGPNGGEIRVRLVEALAETTDNEIPWSLDNVKS